MNLNVYTLKRPGIIDLEQTLSVRGRTHASTFDGQGILVLDIHGYKLNVQLPKRICPINDLPLVNSGCLAHCEYLTKIDAADSLKLTAIDIAKALVDDLGGGVFDSGSSQLIYPHIAHLLPPPPGDWPTWNELSTAFIFDGSLGEFRLKNLALSELNKVLSLARGLGFTTNEQTEPGQKFDISSLIVFETEDLRRYEEAAPAIALQKDGITFHMFISSVNDPVFTVDNREIATYHDVRILIELMQTLAKEFAQTINLGAECAGDAAPPMISVTPNGALKLYLENCLDQGRFA